MDDQSQGDPTQATWQDQDGGGTATPIECQIDNDGKVNLSTGEFSYEGSPEGAQKFIADLLQYGRERAQGEHQAD